MKPVLLFLVVIGFLIIYPAYADDSALQGVEGGSIQPMGEHFSIRMMSETVDIKLGERVGFEWPVFVRCEFLFKNEGPAADVIIGFPERAYASGDASASGRLKGFKSWVDGKPVSVTYKPSSQNKKSDYSEDYKAWYIKKVHFNAGQIRRIVDIYSARLGSYTSTISSMQFDFRYVLKTGASWKGSIGSAIINVDATSAGKIYDIDASPKGAKIKNNKFTWTFKNFEPKEDILLTLNPRMPFVNGKGVIKEQGWMWEPYFERNGVLMVSPQFLNGECKGKDCTIRFNKHILKLHGGSRIASLDGKQIKLKNAPWASNEWDYFSIPLDETVSLLGGSVKYDSTGRPNILLKGLKLPSLY